MAITTSTIVAIVACSMKSMLFILAGVVFAIILLIALDLLGPRLEIARRHRINTYMQSLTERTRATPPDTEALNTLIRLLHSNDSFESTGAAIALGAVGGHAEPAVDALIETLESPNHYTAREASTSLGMIGPAAQRAVPALIKAMQQHSDRDVGWFAAESLGYIADPNDASVITVLEQASKSSDDRMRSSAVKGLHSLASRRVK